MAELSESKIRGLVRLVDRGRIKIENIQNEDYKKEVEKRVNE